MVQVDPVSTTKSDSLPSTRTGTRIIVAIHFEIEPLNDVWVICQRWGIEEQQHWRSAKHKRNVAEFFRIGTS